MTELSRRISTVYRAARVRTTPYAERGARIARRARGAATERLLETRVPDRMRVSADDSFVVGCISRAMLMRGTSWSSGWDPWKDWPGT